MVRLGRRVRAALGSFVALLLVCFAGDLRAADGAPEFKGKIAERYEDSVEWWPQIRD